MCFDEVRFSERLLVLANSSFLLWAFILMPHNRHLHQYIDFFIFKGQVTTFKNRFTSFRLYKLFHLIPFSEF